MGYHGALRVYQDRRRRRDLDPDEEREAVHNSRGDVNDFAEYAISDKQGEPLTQYPIHREMQAHLGRTDTKLNLVEVPRDHGKCVAEGTLIHLADGSRANAEDFKSGDVPALDLADYTFKAAHAECWPNGERLCLRVTAASGQSVVVSKNHPFLTGNGWVRADELGVGLRVALSLEQNHRAGGSVDDESAYVVGFLVGDGGISGHTVRFSSDDPVTISRVATWAESMGWHVSKVKGENHDWQVCGRQGAKTGGPTHFLRDLGMMGKTSYTKRVPREILISGRSTYTSFLSGYFDADGTSTKRRNGCVELYSVSDDLLLDAQYMLSSIGIVSTLSGKNGTYKGRHHKSFRLSIRGTNIQRFCNIVGSESRKSAALRFNAGFYSRINGGGAKIDVIPHCLWFSVVASTAEDRRVFHLHNNYDMSKEKFARLYKEMSGRVNVDLSKVDIQWTKVSAIEDAGVRRTYDVHVEKYHNFIANGFITHNTTQTLIRLLWLIGRRPDIALKIVCETDPPAKKRLGWVKEQIEKNERVKRVFPRLRPGREWSKTQIIVERSDPGVEPTLEACGVTTGATGGRADELDLDDVVGRRNALTTPALKPVVIEAVNNDWLNLLDPKTGRANAVCTGWTRDDWIAHAKKSGAWNVMRRPVDGFRGPWSEKWGEKELRQQLARIGSTAYKRGFELQPLSSEIVAIQPEWVKYWRFKPNLSKLIIFNAYDLTPGVSTSKKADYFAGVTIGLDMEPPGTFYVLRAWHRRISILQQILMIIADAQATNPDAIGIEATQYQAVLPELVQAVGRAALPPIFPLKPRVSKDLRLALVSPQVELGRVLFNPAMAPKRIKDPDERGDLVGELTSFPLGAHDDLVDAWVYAMLMALEHLLASVGDDSDDFDTPLADDLGVGPSSDAVSRIYTGDGVTERLLEATFG